MAAPRKKKKKKKSTWGGARKGAGRPRGRSDHYVPHERRERVGRSEALLVRLQCADDVPSLRNRGIRKTIEEIVANQERDGFRLVHFALLKDALLLLCEANNAEALSRGVQGLASSVARKVNRALGRSGRFFGDRFRTQRLKTPEAAQAALREMFISGSKVNTHSSAAWFDGWARGAGPGRAKGQSPLDAARSPMLTKGWRKKGLLRP